MKCRLLILIFLFLACSDNHFVERAGSDYFPLKEGNTWRYVHETDTVVVEVEPSDTILGRECYPVSYGGYTSWYIKAARAIEEYVKVVHFFSGDEFTIIEDYAMRLELPFVEGNIWQDSLVDSLEISGQWVTAKYYIGAEVTSYDTDDEYGDVYTIELTKTEMIITPDTTYTETESLSETYGPEIGLTRYDYGAGEYTLVDYELQSD